MMPLWIPFFQAHLIIPEKDKIIYPVTMPLWEAIYHDLFTWTWTNASVWRRTKTTVSNGIGYKQWNINLSTPCVSVVLSEACNSFGRYRFLGPWSCRIRCFFRPRLAISSEKVIGESAKMTEAEHEVLQRFIEMSTLPNGDCAPRPSPKPTRENNHANGSVVQNGVKLPSTELALANPRKTQTVVTLDKSPDSWPFGTMFGAASTEPKITRTPPYLFGRPIHDFDASPSENVSKFNNVSLQCLCSFGSEPKLLQNLG